jgi:hypothetical protein
VWSKWETTELVPEVALKIELKIELGAGWAAAMPVPPLLGCLCFQCIEVLVREMVVGCVEGFT